MPRREYSFMVSPIVVRLRELREPKMSLRELARRVGVRPNTISDMETGKTNGIDFDILDRICRELGCEPGDILARVD